MLASTQQSTIRIRHVIAGVGVEIVFPVCVECTSAALQALAEFKQLHPQHRRKEVEICIEKVLNSLKTFKKQMARGMGIGEFGEFATLMEHGSG